MLGMLNYFIELNNKSSVIKFTNFDLSTQLIHRNKPAVVAGVITKLAASQTAGTFVFFGVGSRLVFFIGDYRAVVATLR